MKTLNQIETFRIAKTLKPRNLVLAALKTARAAGLQNGAGAHRKNGGATRRAQTMATLALAKNAD